MLTPLLLALAPALAGAPVLNDEVAVEDWTVKITAPTDDDLTLPPPVIVVVDHGDNVVGPPRAPEGADPLVILSLDPGAQERGTRVPSIDEVVGAIHETVGQPILAKDRTRDPWVVVTIGEQVPGSVTYVPGQDDRFGHLVVVDPLDTLTDRCALGGGAGATLVIPEAPGEAGIDLGPWIEENVDAVMLLPREADQDIRALAIEVASDLVTGETLLPGGTDRVVGLPDGPVLWIDPLGAVHVAGAPGAEVTLIGGSGPGSSEVDGRVFDVADAQVLYQGELGESGFGVLPYNPTEVFLDTDPYLQAEIRIGGLVDTTVAGSVDMFRVPEDTEVESCKPPTVDEPGTIDGENGPAVDPEADPGDPTLVKPGDEASTQTRTGCNAVWLGLLAIPPLVIVPVLLMRRKRE